MYFNFALNLYMTLSSADNPFKQFGPRSDHGSFLQPCVYRIERSRSKIVSEYDQEIPQSQTADYPVAPRGRAAQPSRDTRKTN